MAITTGPIDHTKLDSNIRWLTCLRPLRNMLFSGAFLVPFFGDKGLGFDQIMMLQAFMMICGVSLEVPSGYLADRFGRAIILRTGVLALGLGYLSLAAAPDFWWCIPSELLIAVGYTFISGADTALLIDSLKVVGRFGDYRRIGQRIDRIGYMMAAGGALGGIGIAMTAGFTALVVADGLAASVAIFASSRLTEVPHAERAEDDEDERVTWHSVWHTVCHLAGSPGVVWLIVLGTVSVLQSYLAYWQVLAMVDLAGWPVAWLALILCVRYCVMAAVLQRSRAGPLPPLRRIAVRTTCLVIVAYAGLVLGHWWLLLAVCSNVAYVLLDRPLSDELNRRMPSESRATLNSVVEMLRRFISAIGGFAIGLLVTWSGVTVGFIVAGTVCASIMAAAVWQMQRYGVFREGG